MSSKSNYFRNIFMAKQKLQEERNWYAIHTYAGYENAVARKLRQRIESLGMENMIVTDNSWYIVRNTPRVTGYVDSGIYPGPLEKNEVEGMFKRINAGDTA